MVQAHNKSEEFDNLILPAQEHIRERFRGIIVCKISSKLIGGEIT
jgi:hypothetical protein